MSDHISGRHIGEFLVDIQAMNYDQLNEILVAQQTGDKRIFGEIAIAWKYVDDAALRKYVEKYYDDSLPDFES